MGKFIEIISQNDLKMFINVDHITGVSPESNGLTRIALNVFNGKSLVSIISKMDYNTVCNLIRG